MGRKVDLPGVSFRWKRAIRIAAVKRRILRAIGIPLTTAAQQRKVGKNGNRLMLDSNHVFLLGLLDLIQVKLSIIPRRKQINRSWLEWLNNG